MPELIDMPVTMADFAEVIPSARSLFLAVVGAGGVEGLVRIEDALQLLEVGDFPDISPLVADAIAAKADKATPFVDVASAATIDLGAATSTSVNITGTTGPVAGFGTAAPEGAEYLLRWNGAVTLTNSATLVTGTGADLTTYSGMYMLVKKDASNVWRLIWWSRRLLATGGGTNQLTFNLSALTAGRSITVPDANVTLATPMFVKEYDSGQQTITAGGTLSLSTVSALGGVPKLIAAHLVCVTAQAPWVPGDIIHILNVQFSSTSNINGGATVKATATTIEVTYGGGANVFYAIGGINITPANFRMVVRAWA